MKEVRSLTGIRGVAAVWVVLFHMQFILPWLHDVTIVQRGWAGVDLFFVLSGFILMHTHGQEFARVTGKGLIRFAKLRIGRIYPVNLAVLLIIAVIIMAYPAFRLHAIKSDPSNFSIGGFIQTAVLATEWFLPAFGEWNGPTWSLSAEILGYAAFPLIATGLMNIQSPRVCAAVATVSLSALALYQFENGTWLHNRSDPFDATLRMAYCFVAGAAMSRARDLAPNLGRHAAMLSTGALLLLLPAITTWRFALLTQFGFASLIMTLSYGKGWINDLLASRPVVSLGRISFPLYLIHLMPLLCLQYALQGADLSPLMVFGIACADLVVCLLCATLLHFAVERPCHKLAKAWASRDNRAFARIR